MVRLPRNLSRVAIACSLALPLGSVLPAWAQDGAQPGAAAAPAEPNKELQDAVANYWHYGKIGRYELQAAEGEKILAHVSDPVAVLAAFDRHIASTEFAGQTDNLEQWMLRWQGIEQVRDVTNKINAVLNEGRTQFRADPAFIQKQIERLAGGARAFEGGINELRKSGELAVPMMIDYLRNPQREQFHSGIRRALRELGRAALNPLVAATEMTGQDNAGTLVAVVTAIGDIGYDDGAPFLVRVAKDEKSPGPVREAARQALARMGAGNPNDLNASDLFYELAEKFYYENASITSDVRAADQPANVWYWSNDRGLVRRAVPQQIFNEIMALRAAEYSLKLGGGENAQSLWLAANYKREAELPQGATDPTRAENQPAAHYYGVTSGSQYLNNALARSLRDRNSAVALRVITSLQDIAGRRMLESGSPGPLVDAMGSSDRLVRFEAAFALAQALPQQPFQGQDRVVPLLAEALGQTGSPTVLVIGADPGSTNALIKGLKGAGYTTAGAAGADAGISAAAQLPAVDVIIISEDLGGDVDEVFAAASQNPRLSGASRIVITKTGGSPFAARAINDRMLSVTQVTDPAALKPVIDEARAKGASAPLDQELANQYAARAGDLLEELAISRSSEVLDLMAAEQALLAALNDPRPDIIKSAGAVLARMNVKTVQPALLAAAQAEKPDDVKIALYKNLAQNAAAFGRQIEGEQVENLEQTVIDAQNLDVRAAAAEARGALNLPVEQAKTLIINQSTGTAPLSAPAPAEPAASLR